MGAKEDVTAGRSGLALYGGPKAVPAFTPLFRALKEALREGAGSS